MEDQQEVNQPDTNNNVKDALNEYFKLKSKYETAIEKNKKKIMNNVTLSKREKRAEYLKLKPKCINCSRPGGTRFHTTYYPDTDKEEAYREYTAICGIVADPCDLNIKIQIGKTELLPNILDEMQDTIKKYKNDIIDKKNKLLFGYLDTQQVLEDFEKMKDSIGLYTSLYEDYLTNYNNLVDNEQKNTELKESYIQLYQQIDNVKECIQKMNETDNTQYASDAVHIYVNIIQPLLQKIRALQYNEMTVVQINSTCNLMQTKYSIENLSYTTFANKVVSYDVGVVSKTKKTHKAIQIEDNDSEDVNTDAGPADYTIIPTYTNEGITWNDPEYQKYWNTFPQKLKTVLMTDHEWLKQFMRNYVDEKKKNTLSNLFTPPENVTIPPERMQDGNFDFGVNVYNDAFKALGPGLQKTYLTFYKETGGNGEKDYSMLKNAMNEAVAKYVGFGSSYGAVAVEAKK